MWLESIGLGLVIFFMLVGFLGAFIPLMPGPLLAWLAVLSYVLVTKFTIISPMAFAAITVIALLAATADIWMSLLGARTLGASSRSLLWGIGGALVGFLVLNLLGAVVGYGAGVLYSELRIHNNWQAALRASLGGLAGWGLATVVQAGSVLLIMIIFVWQVFLHRHLL